MQKSLKWEIIFNFFMKADIEDQYMHLDSTFDALSNGTNYKFQNQSKDFFFEKKPKPPPPPPLEYQMDHALAIAELDFSHR